MTDTQTMRAEYETWKAQFLEDVGPPTNWEIWQAACARKPAAQVAGAEPCELRGTGKCGCPTACKVNMAAMITAPTPIYTHPAPEPDATKVVSVPTWQERLAVYPYAYASRTEAKINARDAEIAELRAALAADRERT